MASADDTSWINFAANKLTETRTDRVEVDDDFDTGERFDMGVDDFGF